MNLQNELAKIKKQIKHEYNKDISVMFNLQLFLYSIKKAFETENGYTEVPCMSVGLGIYDLLEERQQLQIAKEYHQKNVFSDELLEEIYNYVLKNIEYEGER